MATPVKGGSSHDADNIHSFSETGKLHGSQQDHDISQLQPGKNQGLTRNGGCNKNTACNVFKWIAIALAITGVVAGLTGLLVCIGQVQIGLAGVGAMSAATGLYTLLAGFGVTFISTILLTVVGIVNRSQAKKEGVNLQGNCFTNFCKKHAKKIPTSDAAAAV